MSERKFPFAEVVGTNGCSFCGLTTLPRFDSEGDGDGTEIKFEKRIVIVAVFSYEFFYFQ